MAHSFIHPGMIITDEQREQALTFYKEAIDGLNACGVDFMIGGGFAFCHYTGIFRDTKDLDVYCRPGDYPKILKYFAEKGYRTELTDVRWLAKVFKDDYYIDLIFDTVNNLCPVEDSWFQHATRGELTGRSVLFLPAEELVWCKIYVQNRDRFDGADINHVLMRYGKQLDWKRLLVRLDTHWHLLLAQLVNFQFVYPHDYREIIPQWLFDELITRAREQYEIPPSLARVCRGPIIDQSQYQVDVTEWGYKVQTMTTT